MPPEAEEIELSGDLRGKRRSGTLECPLNDTCARLTAFGCLAGNTRLVMLLVRCVKLLGDGSSPEVTDELL